MEDFLVVHDLVGTSKTKTLSTVTAIYDVGCFFGALVAFGIGECLGRKKSILLGTTLTAICTLLKCTSYSLLQIFVGRVILGYVSEISGFLLRFLSMTKVRPVSEMASIHQQRQSGKQRLPHQNGEGSSFS